MKKRAYTPNKRLKPNELGSLYLSEEERVFCFLHAVCAVPASKAYFFGFKKCKASLTSCAAAASRLLREARVQEYIRTLYSYHQGGQLDFNENAIKF